MDNLPSVCQCAKDASMLTFAASNETPANGLGTAAAGLVKETPANGLLLLSVAAVAPPAACSAPPPAPLLALMIFLFAIVA